MEDSRIVELFWQRDESALREVESKYGRYCYSIASNVLHNAEDARECVNDTWLGAWNAMPPNRPARLSVFLGRITRNLAIMKWRSSTTAKRGGTSVDVPIDELEECIPSGEAIDENLAAEELTAQINAFLETLDEDERNVFLCRYWFFDSIAQIAKRFGFRTSKVKVMLKRTRDKLAVYLRKEGVYV